ncbi:MAG TPA: peptidylprolyl isomerase [Spirochaetota bacterium]|nr:peptidylprolyl isomerase [Spirochaetota bacterium]HPG49930.1 peptidylprolyl isomerase [Spirochaetota bacterium]HPN11552.1 peptidylprolyl isomerase [Spirochaetota bacterium]HQL81360.1 peptidylprolyl isomerase [Spirochaetota bacterium]
MKMINYTMSAVACMVLLFASTSGFTWETYDSVIAVVNDTSIIESEIDSKFSQLLKFKSIPKNRYVAEKSRILDKYIEDALVMEAADNEAIVVTDRRVLGHIEELMKQYFSTKIQDKKKLDKQVAKVMNRLEKQLAEDTMVDDKELDANIDGFIGFIESRFQIGFKDYFEEIRAQIMREQVMSIAIGVSPPGPDEAMDFYKKNKSKFGDEVWVKHILIVPAGGSFTAERDANQKMSALRERIMAGESFEKLAVVNSQDRESAARGGDLGWKMLAEMDPYLAGYINQMRGTGQISQVFKSGMGYHIVKLMGRRPITYEKVERLIMYKLYNENMFEQFKKWVDRRKKESEIQIFMKNYVAST